MGVAIVFGPLMLLFLLFPIIYLVFAFFSVKSAIKEKNKVSLIIKIFVFSILPAYFLIDYWQFSSACNIAKNQITVAPISDVDTIAFVSEGGDFIVYKPFLWHDEMNLNLKSYEYAYMVNGSETDRYLCDWKSKKCSYGGEISSQYMFLLTSPKRNDHWVLQSDISIIDRHSKKAIYVAHEYVLGGLLAAYHGAFLAKKPGHSGALSCGYLGKDIDVWRTNNGGSPSRLRYLNTDTKLITTIFPNLENKALPN